MGTSEFLAISDTRHFEPSGGEFLAEGRGIATNPLHVATVQGGGVGKLDTYCIWGERVSPTPVNQKRGHEFNTTLLNRWLPAGKKAKMERHGGWRAKDKLTSQGLY
jgi:hypothetical protein